MKSHAIVLGASGGIGQAICRKLAADGWSLYLHYNENAFQAAQLLDELATEFPDQDFQTVRADFSKPDGGHTLASLSGRIQAVIVASGQSMLKLLSDTSVEEMDALWRVHMQNPASFISLVSPSLRSFSVSYVVFIGSIWGETGAAGEVMYSAIKGAQQAFVKAYAKEAAYTGTRVNAITPGWIETGMNDDLTLEDKQTVIDQIPLRSTGTPTDVAELVGFLLSGKVDYMTGEILKLNGGWHI